ncbi:MAG TPA: hypothetical protein VK675_03520 [Candidatus Paceibacterota bacterium]|nr:hypothetical protein [Candidatus Paceibacterota bacterium]
MSMDSLNQKKPEDVRPQLEEINEKVPVPEEPEQFIEDPAQAQIIKDEREKVRLDRIEELRRELDVPGFGEQSGVDQTEKHEEKAMLDFKSDLETLEKDPSMSVSEKIEKLSEIWLDLSEKSSMIHVQTKGLQMDLSDKLKGEGIDKTEVRQRTGVGDMNKFLKDDTPEIIKGKKEIAEIINQQSLIRQLEVELKKPKNQVNLSQERQVNMESSDRDKEDIENISDLFLHIYNTTDELSRTINRNKFPRVSFNLDELKFLSSGENIDQEVIFRELDNLSTSLNGIRLPEDIRDKMELEPHNFKAVSEALEELNSKLFSLQRYFEGTQSQEIKDLSIKEINKVRTKIRRKIDGFNDARNALQRIRDRY